MKTVIFLALLLLPARWLPAQEFSTASMRPITLGQAYRLALDKSEALAREGEAVKQLDAAERAIAASFRPVFEANAAQSKQQNAASSTRVYLSGSYRLFSGMRDYISAKAAGARTAAASLDLERARQRFYLDTAGAYLDLYAAQQEALIRMEQLAVAGKRIAELEARTAIGRSRKSELTAARAQQAQDMVSYLDAVSAERAAQQALRFLTGLEEDLAPAWSLPWEDRPALAPLRDYQDLALRRPDLRARQKSREAYDYLSDIQDRALWPVADLSGNYYAVRRPMPSPENRWDAAIALRVPLYTGGEAAALKASARAAGRSAALEQRQAERQALSEVRAAYDEHVYAELKAAALNEALSLVSDNARYQREDYRLGLVTNLDVINALNTELQTRLSLSLARIRSAYTLLRLENAAGLEPKQ